MDMKYSESHLGPYLEGQLRRVVSGVSGLGSLLLRSRFGLLWSSGIRGSWWWKERDVGVRVPSFTLFLGRFRVTTLKVRHEGLFSGFEVPQYDVSFDPGVPKGGVQDKTSLVT